MTSTSKPQIPNLNPSDNTIDHTLKVEGSKNDVNELNETIKS